MKVAQITKRFASNFGLESSTGVIVTQVNPGSQADLAGIRAKDIITQINHMQITALDDYNAAIEDAKGNVLIKTNRGFLMVQE